MNCPHCGKQIADNAVMCPYCNKFMDSKPTGKKQGNGMSTTKINQKASPAKKKHTGLWVVLGILVVLFIIGIANGGKDSNTSKSKGTNSAPVSQKEPEDMDTSSGDREEAQENLKSALGGGSVLFYNYVNNDVTGRWRMLVYYSAESIVDHAAEYYDAYFESDDEVHMVVNLGLRTTSTITFSLGSLYIDVHEYVEDEEHDAKVLGSGTLLNSYIVDLSSGEIEALNDNTSFLSLESLVSAFEAILSQSYSGCDVTYDDEGITVNVWVDGIAMALATTQASGGGADNENWVAAKNGTLAMAGSLRETMDTAGHDGIDLIINVLNDQNHENTVLTIVNTTIVYDVLAE